MPTLFRLFAIPVCVLVAACLSSCDKGKDAPAATAAAEEIPDIRAAVRFEKDVYREGNIPFSKQEHTVRFPFENISGKPLRVERIGTSCGCLSAVSEPEVVPPGGRGEIVGKIQLSGKPSQQNLTVTFEGYRVSYGLGIELTVANVIGWEPRRPVIDRVAGVDAQLPVVLTWTGPDDGVGDGIDLSIVSNSADLLVDPNAIRVKKFPLTLNLIIPGDAKLEGSSSEATLAVTTSFALMERFEIPVLIRTAAAVEAIPPAVVRTVAADSKEEVVVTVRRRDGKAFTLTPPADAGSIGVVAEGTDQAAEQHRVRLTVDRAKAFSTRLSFAVGPDGGTLEIPVDVIAW